MMNRQLTYIEAYAYVNKVISDVNELCTLTAVPDMTVREGTSKSGPEGVTSLQVGIKELIPTDKNRNMPVNEYDFMSCLVGVYHERQHLQHYNDYFHRNDEISRSLAINYFATIENEVYYFKNYRINPREIDAEFAGLIGAHSFCEAAFGKEEAERLICLYVNTGIRHGDKAFIKFQHGKPYVTTDSIYDEMSNALNRSIYAHRTYNLKLAMRNASKNVNARLLHQNGDKYYYQILKKEPNGYLQDQMMAALFFYQGKYYKQNDYYKYYQMRFESIQDLDLRPETVFQPQSHKERVRSYLDVRQLKQQEIDRLSTLVKNILDEDNSRGIEAEERFGHIAGKEESEHSGLSL